MVKKFVAGLLLVLLLVGCAATAATVPAKQSDAAADNKTTRNMSDEERAAYCLQRGWTSNFNDDVTAWASLSQAYYLKLIYAELKRQNELLEKLTSSSGGGR